MKRNSDNDVTDLLIASNSGDQNALDQLLPMIYEELRRIAHGRLRHERDQHTLQTTGLVNEAYLRLCDQRESGWENRSHFLAIAAQMMRRVLVDYARKRQGQKRGGDVPRITLDQEMVAELQPTHEILALDDALQSLSGFDPRKAKMVELRFFGGLTIEETATALDVSPGTVMRDWTLTKAWLQREIVGIAPD